MVRVKDIIEYLSSLDPEMVVKETNSAAWFNEHVWDTDMETIRKLYLPIKTNRIDKNSKKKLDKPVLIIHDISMCDY